MESPSTVTTGRPRAAAEAGPPPSSASTPARNPRRLDDLGEANCMAGPYVSRHGRGSIGSTRIGMRDSPLPLALQGVSLTLPSAAGPVEILRGVDFAVAPRERVAVTGPSGS